VGEDISFDEALLKEFNCKIFAFDPTPKSIEWIKKHEIHNNFLFFPYGLSTKTENQKFYLPKNKKYVSGSIFLHEAVSNDTITVQMKNLEDIAKEQHHTYIDILKMDIEGSEFSIIKDFPLGISFGQICVEFHERFIKNGKTLLKQSIKELKKRGYFCFAISKTGQEYSFINKKEYEKKL
jgi:FkbM family methyltransferase